MAYDFKKEFKELYKPSSKPSILTVPPMSYIAVRGKGDPNTEGGEYQSAIPLLYGVAYTIKMSKKGPREIEGFFDFVVPPLEGFWWQERTNGEIDYARKDDFNFISCIRLPDSSPATTSSGQLQKLPLKRSWISRRSSCSGSTRACVFNACILDPTTASRRP